MELAPHCPSKTLPFSALLEVVYFRLFMDGSWPKKPLHIREIGDVTVTVRLSRHENGRTLLKEGSSRCKQVPLFNGISLQRSPLILGAIGTP